MSLKCKLMRVENFISWVVNGTWLTLNKCLLNKVINVGKTVIPM